MPLRFFLLLVFAAFNVAIARESRLPRIFLVGDSTVQNPNKGQQGWGTAFSKWVDDNRFVVENRASGGRSSRSFLREGLWADTLEDVRPGDFVLIQFGHNDSGPVEGNGGLGSLPGIGNETREVVHKGRPETVLTYGAYLSRFIADAKARGAQPILCSPVPLNSWKGKRVLRTYHEYAKWARDIARMHSIPFLDLQEIVARRYEELGHESVNSECFTSADDIHTTPLGAVVTAQCVAKAIWKLQLQPLSKAMRANPRKY